MSEPDGASLENDHATADEAASVSTNSETGAASRSPVNKTKQTASDRSRTVPDGLLRRFSQHSGRISTSAVHWLEEQLEFFADLPADQKAQIHLIIQSAVRDFANWIRNPDAALSETIAGFKLLPSGTGRALTLQQTVQLVRSTVDYFELVLPRVSHNATQRTLVIFALLRFGRELGFTAAEVYAAAAEDRGSWDSRMEAMLVDAIIRGDTRSDLSSSAAALNWDASQPVTIIIGTPNPDLGLEAVRAAHIAAKKDGRKALAVVQGARLMIVLSGALPTAQMLSAELLEAFSNDTVVVGPTVTNLSRAPISAAEALSAFDAVVGWPGAPRPISALDVLPERILAGDRSARKALFDRVIRPLRAADPSIENTLQTYLEHGGQVESTARELFVHPNTVRYRLRRVSQLCQFDPLDSRDSFVLRIALTLGRLESHKSQ